MFNAKIQNALKIKKFNFFHGKKKYSNILYYSLKNWKLLDS